MPATELGEHLVAAPDSPISHNRFEAGIYHAKATNAQREIQTALDDLPPAGGTVRILAGNYELSKQTDQSFCVQVKGNNKRLILDQGAILKLADNQFESTAGQVIQVGDGTTLTGLATPNQIAVEENLALWGPGVVDGNEANSNAKAIGVKGHGNLLWFRLGGGLTIKNCESNPLSISGVSVGGDAADYHVKHTVIGGLRVIDSTEGIFFIRMRYTTVNHLHVDGISAQDGLEPINCDHLAMANSVIRNTEGSALDIFSSSSGATDSYQTYTNCVFGPINVANAVVEVGGGTSVAAHKIILFESCVIDMKNADSGIEMGTTTGVGTTVGVAVRNCIVDGTSGASGSDGIRVGAAATETSIIGNHISNCLGNAIDRSANPDKLHMKSNSGWGNGAGISSGTGSDNVDTANDFIA